MNERLVRLRVVASKEDNPWLPDDLTAMPGICIKMSPGHSLSELNSEETALVFAKSSIRSIFARLRRDGLL